jgi:hypothetical protein
MAVATRQSAFQRTCRRRFQFQSGHRQLAQASGFWLIRYLIDTDVASEMRKLNRTALRWLGFAT